MERTIEAGQRTFVEVGLALTEIRDSKLYRADFQTFEAYCQAKWGWTRQRAYQIIDAADVKKTLPEECQKNLTKESHAAALAKVPAEKRVKVLERAAESGPVTAKAIHEAAAIVAPSPATCGSL